MSAIISVLALPAGGLCHLATVCTSFVWVNSATHGRSIAVPESWREAPPEYVQIGTLLAARSSILALLAWAMGAMWVLEQPSTSVMIYIPSWQEAVRFFCKKAEQGWPRAKLWRNSIFMAAFKGSTLKPLSLFSCECLEVLMNMPIPPKKDRPPSEAPVAYVYPDL